MTIKYTDQWISKLQIKIKEKQTQIKDKTVQESHEVSDDQAD
jgi:hypothetical protein